MAKPKDKDPEQSERFIREAEKLRAAGVLPSTDEADGELDRLLSRQKAPEPD